jgi:hypothetical protein
LSLLDTRHERRFKEMIMKLFSIAAVALATLSSAAYAQVAPQSDPFSAIWSQSARPISAPRGAASTPKLVRNPNECAADRAEPVWSAKADIVGYACQSEVSGG